MIVLKFGGTSVSSKSSINTICKVVVEKMPENPIIVVSALKNITDLLVSLISSSKGNRKAKLKQILSIHAILIKQLWLNKQDQGVHISYIKKQLKEINDILEKYTYTLEIQDNIISYGEIISSYIISQYFLQNSIAAKQIIATEILVTNDKFSRAEFYPNLSKIKMASVIKPLVEQSIVPVITGFIGATKSGKITTLGRGGSDYTAAIIGYCLRANEIQIWTDVSGVYSADPRVVGNAKVLKSISYEYAEALADSGAKILHPKTIRPAVKYNIPIRVLNTFDSDSKGTLIVNKDQLLINEKIRALSYKRINADEAIVCLIELSSYSKQLLQTLNSFLSKYSEDRVSFLNYKNYCYNFLVNLHNPEKLINELHNKFIA